MYFLKRFLFFLTLCLPAYINAQDSTLVSLYQDSLKHDKPFNSGFWLAKIAEVYSSINPDSCKRYYLHALKSDFVKENLPHKASINNNLGVLYQMAGHFDSAIHYHKQARNDYLTTGNHSGAGYSAINMGIIYKDLGLYNIALTHLFNAENLMKGKENQRALSSCYNTIGSIYSRQNEFEKSLEFYRRSLEIRKFLKADKLIAASLNNIGTLFRKTGMVDSALHFYKKSIVIKNRLNDYGGLGVAYNNIGMVYMDQLEYNLSESYLLKSYHIKKDLSDKQGEVITLNNLGKLYTNTGNYNIGYLYLDKAERIIKTNNLLDEHKDNLENKLKLYELMSMPTEALQISKLLLIVKDSLLNRDKIQALVEMREKYEFERNMQEIAMLEQQKDLQEAKLQLNQIWITSLVICSILFFVIGILITTQWRKERSHKEKIGILLLELHHRVKNNLQILSSLFRAHSRTINDKDAIEAVKEGEIRVKAMALIHQKLYNNPDHQFLNIKEFLIDFTQDLARSYGIDTVQENINVKVESLELDVNLVIPISLIVMELVTNSFKYAYPVSKHSFIFIEITSTDKDLTLRFGDNGCGFERNNISKQSRGLYIVDSLAQQIDAQIEWGTNGKSLFQMRLPLI